uniref:CD109 antigen n=2 Tax=Macrostomum lignano TaxID=282301 RepID=A0A1I8JIC9_9PLAT
MAAASFDVPLLLLSTIFCCLLAGAGGQQAVPATSMELPPTPTYLVLVPRKIRPEQEFRVSATVFRMLYDSLTFRVSVRRLNEPGSGVAETEYAFAEETFTRAASRLIRVRIPENTPTGTYNIHVEGSVKTLGGLVFYNRTEIIYEPRLFSAFIQFSKPIYAMGDIVRFRVFPYESNLMVKNRVFTSIEVVDSKNVSVRRWLSPRNNAKGFIELSYQLADTSNHGSWKVRCTREAFVTERSFLVFFNTITSMISVNITMPQRLSEFAFGVYGILEANHTTNAPVFGNASIRLEFRQRGAAENSPPIGVMWKDIPYFYGRSDFLFTMSEISSSLKLSDRPSNLEVRADAFVYDWYFLVNQTSYAYTVIFREIPEVKFLGGYVRQFKPGFPFTALLWVFQPDGRKPDFRYRKLTLEVYCDRSKRVKTDASIPIPDDSVVRYPIETSMNCLSYRLYAVLLSSTTSKDVRTAEQFLFRHYSPSGAYMQVTTSTVKPTVDRYMVFNIKTNYYSDRIYYIILGGGNILHSDILFMPAGVQSRTFSIALSREIAPIARIVAYFMKQDGELVTDSMSFFVDVLSINSVDLQVTQGSDLTGKSVTGWITGANVGSFVLLSAIPYDLYLRYGNKVILEPYTLLQEQMSYEAHAEQPLQFAWFDDTSDMPQLQYFPSPTYGPDANKTMNYSGMIMFTDSNYTKVTFWHTCNETLNPDRAFPCYAGSPDECYGYRHICDGKLDCNTGVDEMNCDRVNLTSAPGYVEPKFKFEYRHFIYDDLWLWQDVYMKANMNGRVPFNPAVTPKLETSWVVGAIAIDGERGVQVQSVPTRFTSTRRFYMVLEAPPYAYWGEQIGVRVAVFNRFDYWTEVIIELKKSTEYDFIKVGYRGQVNSYAPELASNENVHTVVFLPAGGHRMLYFPVLPRNTGNTTITFCAYSFNGGECSTVNVPVIINGAPNNYSTPILLDLVSNSELLAQNFFITPEQAFVEPERRWRRFVPGSKYTKISVVGDIVGPSLGNEMPYGDAASTVWRPIGSGESVLFNINWNVQMLHYLRMTKQLEAATLNSALEYVNSQLSRLSFYINPVTGGMANFPERFNTETSTFLTAFGLFTLAETSFSQWDRVTAINADLFQKFILYLNATQDTGAVDPSLAGSFTDDIQWDMKYFNVYIKDKSVNPANNVYLRRVPITALAVIATRHPSIPMSLGSHASRVSTAAIQYLKRHLSKMTEDALSLAMTAYALTFDSSSSDKSTAMNLLMSIARDDNYLYWANRRVKPLIREPDSAGKVIIKARIEWPNDAYAVQASSFAMLAMFKSVSSKPELKSNITKVINFITETKNAPQGWISTQDTLFAVRALREVAQLDFNRVIYSLQVDINPTSDTSKSSSLRLDGNNLSIPRTFYLDNDNTWGEVMIRATGSGRAVLHMFTTKSVEQEFLVKNAIDPNKPNTPFQTFELSCVPTFSGRNSSMMHMTACARWTWTARSETSGMALLQFTVPSGYLVTNYDMRNFVQTSNVRGLRHIWMVGQYLNVFFTNFTSVQPTCVTIPIPRWYPVANTTVEQPCNVYEYFEFDNRNFSFYSARSLHSSDICKVCGSFQCPYCIDYNTASALTVSAALLTSCLVMALAAGYGKLTRLSFLTG